MSEGRLFCYIASPYSKGDPAINTNFQCAVFDKLLDDGIVWPYAPLVSHFQHTLFPRPYEDWIAYDNAMLTRFDVCLRLNAEVGNHFYFQSESSGADGEVKQFQERGKPVFYSIEQMYEWIRNTTRPVVTDDWVKLAELLDQA